MSLTDEANMALNKAGYALFAKSYGDLYVKNIITASELTVVLKMSKWDVLDLISVAKKGYNPKSPVRLN